MPKHTVAAGDSIPSIAHDNGFLSDTIWEHPENAALKARRKNPNILFPGDEVFIPERELKQVTKPTNSKHVFKVRGEPNKFKLHLMRSDKPRAHEEYVLQIEGKFCRGKTDANGVLEHVIPRNARSGVLILRGGQEQYPIKIGHLDPVEEIAGVQQRLNNLGFDCGAANGELNEETQAALRQFQAKHKLTESGDADAVTRSKLRELHP